MSENYFLNRRSCRNFKNESIDDSVLKNIITQSVKAPTCGNMQLYSIIVTRDPERLKKLAPCHFNQPASTTAPVILTICADFNRFKKWCDINNAKSGFENFHSFITAMTDAVIVAQQIVTVAEQMGLATCYLGTVTYNAEEISRLLELPKLVVPVASVALGIPESLGEETNRLPLKGVVHFEKYEDPDDRTIRDLFRVHDEDPGNEAFIKENNKDNLAQVFAEVRYPGEMNEKLSVDFYNLLKKKGFQS